MTTAEPPMLDPQTLKRRLRETRELALIDVREQGVFYHRHLLLASCVPLSRLELRIGARVPRRTAPIVVCDDDGGAAAATAWRRLAALGYRDVVVLAGGVAGWEAAGFEVFSGINVPSKAFGEVVEHRYDTPRLSAEALKQRLDRGDDVVILDSRPFDEFHRMSIPGGIDCAGAELVYRAFAAAPDPATLVVVNCAGRTRSIIGAQSLIDAGLPNPVAALKDGTMGWTLAGFELARGCQDIAAAPDAAAWRRALAAAEQVAARFGVRGVDAATLAGWRRDADPDRTLYLFDVRTPQEYCAGHLAGSRSAPGGQLIQATDEYMAVRHGRVVLVDERRVRALMTGSWLRRMGWDEVYVLAEPFAETAAVVRGGGGADEVPLDAAAAALPALDAAALRARLDGDTPPLLLDLNSSLRYRRGRVPGACWGLRTRPLPVLERVDEGGVGALVVYAEDDALARLAAAELQAQRPGLDVAILAGGSDAWQGAGYALSGDDGGEVFLGATDDVWYKPYEYRDRTHQAMQDYLRWEVELVEQIERDGDLRFYHRTDRAAASRTSPGLCS